MADNWYLILDLEFDPPMEDEKIIAERIEERRKFWDSKRNDSVNGTKYRVWAEKISDIRKDMIGAANIRKELAEDACNITYAPVDKLLKTIGRKGNITGEEGEKLSKKLKVSLQVVERRAEKLGIKWGESDSAKHYRAIYERYYQSKPQNAITYNNLKSYLDAFNVKTLYDFLYLKTTIKDSDRLPAESLYQRAVEKFKTEFENKHDDISGTGSKLCGACKETFKDENSKKIYDKYLEYLKCKVILEDAKSVAEISGELNAEQVEMFIGQLTQFFRDRKLSEEVFIAFCEVKEISYYHSKNENIKVCRCGFINDISDGRKVCSSCGSDLEIKCPKCGLMHDADIKVCKCGFEFENMDRALALCELAEYALNVLNFAAAKGSLSDAVRYWEESPKVQALKERIDEIERRVGKEVTLMQDMILKKNFCDARKQYESIQKLFPGYSDDSVEEMVSQEILKAEALFQQAKVSKSQKEIFELCARAYEFCADLPGLKSMIPPPPTVPEMSVKAHGDIKANIISWTAFPDQSIRYLVVKNKNHWIHQISDGEIIFKGSANSYTDRDIEPGVLYYYNVFSERVGIYSEGSKGESVVNLFEISGVNITPSDRSLNITWNRIPENATVEIYEIKSNGQEISVSILSSESCLISGLINGSVYTYRVALSYNINGNKQRTQGVTVKGVPDCPPQPVDTLRVKSLQNDNFEAIWYEDGSSNVQLFGSAQRPRYNIGDIVSLSNLEKEMFPLQLRPLSSQTKQNLKEKEHGGAFQYNGAECLYVSAVSVKSGSGVFGSIARAVKGETLHIASIREANRQIHIQVETPEKADGFVVLYRFDRFPIDIEDPKAVRKYIPLKLYQLNSSIVLNNSESKKYYFSVFSEFRHEGDRDYSSGSDYLFDNSPKENITYSISVRKKLFGGSTVVLEFEAENQEFDLPAVDIMYATGNTPMFKSSSKLFHSIPAQHVDSSLEVCIPFPKGMEKDTYIKAFFKDEEQQKGNQLRLKLKSNYKIN